MKTDLIVSTYNAPRALALSLASVPTQLLRPDTVLIADDGSGSETREVIDAFKAAHPEIPVEHVWHEDNGFEKNAILNKAIQASSADYLIFTDGDCLMHPTFVQRHVELARPKRFVCGSLIRLGPEATKAVVADDITSGRVFDGDWLRRWGTFDRLGTWLKAMPFPVWVSNILEQAWPIRKSWMGSNSASWRDDAIAINGFDEDMKYGGGDKEFGIRLLNSGIKARSIRFTAPIVHLDHPRGYVDARQMRLNRATIEATRRSGKTWTVAGLEKDHTE